MSVLRRKDATNSWQCRPGRSAGPEIVETREYAGGLQLNAKMSA